MDSQVDLRVVREGDLPLSPRTQATPKFSKKSVYQVNKILEPMR